MADLYLLYIDEKGERNLDTIFNFFIIFEFKKNILITLI